MKKRITYLSIYLFIHIFHYGQINLVPNSSFEDTVGSNCWPQMSITSVITTSNNLFTKNWITYKNMNPEFYNVCANSQTIAPYPNASSIAYNCEGYQMPHSGNSYAGGVLYYLNKLPDSVDIYSELIVVKLKETLKFKSCYSAEFYYSFANVNQISINQLGMLFTQTTNTTNPFVFDNTSQYQTQADTNTFLNDTINWSKISSCFIANGGEEYLTIGNIRDGLHLKKKFINTNFTTPCGLVGSERAVYVYIDDVSLYELHNHSGAQSYTLCAGDSLLLGDTVSLPVRYQWSLNGVVVDTTKSIMVGAGAHFGSAQWPVGANSITVVLQTKHCTTQTQTITIVIDKNCNSTDALEVPNVFTPNGDGVNDVFEFSLPKNGTLSGAEVKSFNVFNRWGTNVASAPLSHQAATKTIVQWDGRTTSGIECTSGVYFYVLEYTDANGDVKKMNGYISLIR